MRASVLAGGNASPVLDPSEDVLDLVALEVEILVVAILGLAVVAWRDARGDAAFGKRLPEQVAVIVFVREQFLGAGKRGEQ